MTVYTCAHCPFTSTKTSNMCKHRKRHATVKSFLCAAPGCGKNFLTNIDLGRHKRLHLRPLEVCPNACGFTADTAHKMKCHGAKCPAAPQPPPAAAAQQPEAKEAVVHACGLHGCTFSSPRKWCVIDHQLRMHDPKRGNALACMKCEYIGTSHAGLLLHVRQHNGKAWNGKSKSGEAAAAAKAAVAAAEADELAGVDL